jgi:hypothetical protein
MNFTRRRDFNVRHISIVYYLAHEFCMSAAIFRSKFLQQFSAANFRGNFPQQIST